MSRFRKLPTDHLKMEQRLNNLGSRIQESSESFKTQLFELQQKMEHRMDEQLEQIKMMMQQTLGCYYFEEDDVPKETDQEMKNEAGGRSEVKDLHEEAHKPDSGETGLSASQDSDANGVSAAADDVLETLGSGCDRVGDDGIGLMSDKKVTTKSRRNPKRLKVDTKVKNLPVNDDNEVYVGSQDAAGENKKDPGLRVNKTSDQPYGGDVNDSLSTYFQKLKSTSVRKSCISSGLVHKIGSESKSEGGLKKQKSVTIGTCKSSPQQKMAIMDMMVSLLEFFATFNSTTIANEKIGLFYGFPFDPGIMQGFFEDERIDGMETMRVMRKLARRKRQDFEKCRRSSNR